MATLATLYDMLVGKSGERAETQARRAAEQRAEEGRLRPFPNDDVHLFVKKIDNSRVVRADDPEGGKVCWKTIGGAGAAAVLVIGMLLPTGYNLMAGYQIEDLKREQARLEAQQSALEVEEERLASPARLAELAKRQRFLDPQPDQVVHLPETGSVARNGGASEIAR